MAEILKYKNTKNENLMEKYNQLMGKKIQMDEQLEATQQQLELLNSNNADKDAISKMIERIFSLIGKSETLNRRIKDILQEMGKYTDKDDLDIAEMWKKAKAETAGLKIIGE